MRRHGVRAWGLALLCVLAASAAAPPPADEGVLPVGADGRALNLDFETGTLKDWTAEGEAFVGQPIKGDTVQPRPSDSRSRHQGPYWIGTYERKGDMPSPEENRCVQQAVVEGTAS